MKINIQTNKIKDSKRVFVKINCIPVFRMYGFQFVAHRNLEQGMKFGKKWIISELSSGASVGWPQVTKTLAIETAKNILKRAGKKKVSGLIYAAKINLNYFG